MIIQPDDPMYDEKSRARDVLYQVIDPELFVNIVDLGLIYDINFEDDEIKVRMTLSTPHCPMGDAITSGVENALGAEFPGKTPAIDLTFDPPWTFEMLSPEGRRQLGV